jgi:hypothetical protein
VNCFFNKVAKISYPDLKWKQKFCKAEKPIPVVLFLQKGIVLNRMYTEIDFQRCCASHNKPRKIKTNSNLRGICSKNISIALYTIGVQ